MDLLANIALGLETALTWHNLLYCLIGVTLGTFVGVIPGLGPMSTMSMLFPITFYLDPASALILLAGIWYGSGYGGRTASILLNVPGTPAHSIVCVDGYPMAQQGRAGVALLMTAIASFVGASVGILLMMLISQPLASVALSFGPWEYFSLMVLGLIAASAVSDGRVLKALAMVVLGVTFGVAGLDGYTGTPRFTFGVLELTDGISLAALAMGVFGVAEMITSARTVGKGTAVADVTMRSMRPTRDDVRRSVLPMLRASGIGSLIGVMPGVGPALASFLSYAAEKRIARDPSRFGKGAIEGVVAPEAADNAAEQTAFIPTMSLGIPGSASMALILGVLMIHGITPGPSMITEKPEMFWGLVMSFWIGNVLLMILNVPFIGLWIRLLTIPYRILYPSILVFICIGVFSIKNSIFDIYMVLLFGCFGYILRVLGFPLIPLLLGFILGPLAEDNFMRSMMLSRGSFADFFTRPVSGTLFAMTGAFLLWAIWRWYQRSGRAGIARDKAPAV